MRKVERGDPTVSAGVLAAALWALGFDRRLAELLNVDPVGEAEARRREPGRASRPRIDFDL